MEPLVLKVRKHWYVYTGEETVRRLTAIEVAHYLWHMAMPTP